MTSEPVTAVIVTERTSGLSEISGVVSQAIKYIAKKECKSNTELYYYEMLI